MAPSGFFASVKLFLETNEDEAVEKASQVLSFTRNDSWRLVRRKVAGAFYLLDATKSLQASSGGTGCEDDFCCEFRLHAVEPFYQPDIPGFDSKYLEINGDPQWYRATKSRSEADEAGFLRERSALAAGSQVCSHKSTLAKQRAGAHRLWELATPRDSLAALVATPNVLLSLTMGLREKDADILLYTTGAVWSLAVSSAARARIGETGLVEDLMNNVVWGFAFPREKHFRFSIFRQASFEPPPNWGPEEPASGPSVVGHMPPVASAPPAPPALSSDFKATGEEDGLEVGSHISVPDKAPIKRPPVKPGDLGSTFYSFTLGALCVLMCDPCCRRPMLRQDPGLKMLARVAAMSETGYSLPSEPYLVQELAANALHSVLLRDAHCHASFVEHGGIASLHAILASGSLHAQHCAAATLTLFMRSPQGRRMLGSSAQSRELPRALLEVCSTCIAELNGLRSPRGSAPPRMQGTLVGLMEASGLGAWGALVVALGDNAVDRSVTYPLRQALHGAVMLGNTGLVVMHLLGGALALLASDFSLSKQLASRGPSPAPGMAARPPDASALLHKLLVVQVEGGASAPADLRKAALDARVVAAAGLALLAQHPGPPELVPEGSEPTLWGPNRSLLNAEGSFERIIESSGIIPGTGADGVHSNSQQQRVFEQVVAAGSMFLATESPATDASQIHGIIGLLRHSLVGDPGAEPIASVGTGGAPLYLQTDALTMQYLHGACWSIARLGPEQRTMLISGGGLIILLDAGKRLLEMLDARPAEAPSDHRIVALRFHVSMVWMFLGDVKDAWVQRLALSGTIVKGEGAGEHGARSIWTVPPGASLTPPDVTPIMQYLIRWLMRLAVTPARMPYMEAIQEAASSAMWELAHDDGNLFKLALLRQDVLNCLISILHTQAAPPKVRMQACMAIEVITLQGGGWDGDCEFEGGKWDDGANALLEAWTVALQSELRLLQAAAARGVLRLATKGAGVSEHIAEAGVTDTLVTMLYHRPPSAFAESGLGEVDRDPMGVEGIAVEEEAAGEGEAAGAESEELREAVLGALKGLSRSPENQVRIIRSGVYTLLRLRYEGGVSAAAQELAREILSNCAKNPRNQELMYHAELKCKVALSMKLGAQVPEEGDVGSAQAETANGGSLHVRSEDSAFLSGATSARGRAGTPRSSKGGRHDRLRDKFLSWQNEVGEELAEKWKWATQHQEQVDSEYK
ncbi:hypothetical protein CYMTET_13887, partial [Cymbomonas tetramitiformis]